MAAIGKDDRQTTTRNGHSRPLETRFMFEPRLGTRQGLEPDNEERPPLAALGRMADGLG